ncbi:MAG: MarR family winged helix-turn-helix transcriptional regulator [Steroidobacteraceae bacterium]
MSLSQVALVEKSLKGLSRHVPDMPLVESMVLRVAIILGRDLNARLDRLLKPAGLAEAEYRVLIALLSCGGSAIAGALCAALAQSPANLTRVCDALVRRKLVARGRHADDRRKIVLLLQPAGEKLLHSLLPRISGNVAAVFAGFKVAERKRLLADLKRLLAGIDALNARDQLLRDKVSG